MKTFYTMLTMLFMTSYLSVGQIPTDGLIAHYPFNGNANDVSGHGYNGVVSGATLTIDRFDKTNKAYNFDSSHSKITLPYTDVPHEISISLWVNFDSLPPNETVNGQTLYHIVQQDHGAYAMQYFNHRGVYKLLCGVWSNGGWTNDSVQFTFIKHQWYHIVMVYDSANQKIETYIDNVKVGTQSGVSPPAGDDPRVTDESHLGRSISYYLDNDPGSYHLHGKLDDIRIYNRPLSESEVNQLFTESADGLMAYYPFNGNANDSSGNNLHGLPNGDISWTVDRFGNPDGAVYFDGNGDWIKVDNASSLCYDVSSEDYSISLFVRDDNSGHGKLILMNRWNSNNTHSIGLMAYSDSLAIQLTSYINQPGFFNHSVSGGCTDILYKWHHIVAIHDHLYGKKIYVDGILKDSLGPTSATTSKDNVVTIGAGWYGEVTNFFKGALDDMRIYNRVISYDEILGLFHERGWPLLDSGLVAYYPFNGNANDESGNEYHGIVHGCTLTTDRFDSANRAYLFNGKNNNIELPYTDVPNQISISIWVNFYSLPTTDPINGQTLYQIVQENHGSYLLNYSYNSGAYTLLCGVWGNSGWSFNTIYTVFNTFQWYHIVMVYDSANQKIETYIDNVKVGTQSGVSPPAGDDPRVTDESHLGRALSYYLDNDPGSYQLDGKLDDVRIYNRPLSATEVQELYYESGSQESGSNHGSIAGVKFNDLNGNGTKDQGEPGIANWRIRLFRNDVQVDSALTDASGTYTFNVLEPDTYTVREKMEVNWVQTAPITEEYSDIIVDTNSVITGKDFGNASTLGTIAGMKYNDFDGDGIKDIGEPGVQNWLVRIIKDDIQLDSTLTDGNGNYSFSGLIAGTYTVQENTDPEWIQINPDNGVYTDIILGSGSTVTNIDFGNLRLGTISGEIFNDINGNSVKDVGEPGLANWWVKISGDKTDSTLTNSLGYYYFTKLPMGTYIISEVQQSEWELTCPSTPGTYTITIDSSSQVFSSNDFGNLQSAPKIKIALVAYDASYSPVRTIYWGIRDGASYGIWGFSPEATSIDQAEGEYELPPPPAAFDTRFMDPRGGSGLFGQGSRVDMRDYVDSAVVDTYKVKFNEGSGGYPITFKWSKSEVQQMYSGSIVLVDKYGSSTNMKSVDSIVVSDLSINHLFIIATNPKLPLLYQKGWNMLSVDVNLSEGRKEILFPTASSNAFSYDPIEGYMIKDTLKQGIGYWLKFPSGVTSVSYAGETVLSDTINVATDWNMIGTISVPVAVNQLITIPEGIIGSNLFGYDFGYQMTDTLMPKKAYWVKINEPGQIIMNNNMLLAKATGDNAIQRDANVLKIEDSDGNCQRLYFTEVKTLGNRSPSFYDMPPIPPDGIFDVRYGTNRMLETYHTNGSIRIPVNISSAKYPVKISWEIKCIEEGIGIDVDDNQIPIMSDGTITILSPDSRIALTRFQHTDIPKLFSLEQNYPNPFNPVTLIRYTLPEVSEIVLSVYNTLGQRVVVLVDGKQEAGYHEITFDASQLTSGLYFYRLQTGTSTDVRKMLLVK